MHNEMMEWFGPEYWTQQRADYLEALNGAAKEFLAKKNICDAKDLDQALVTEFCMMHRTLLETISGLFASQTLENAFFIHLQKTPKPPH